jgi:hypothetical protein
LASLEFSIAYSWFDRRCGKDNLRISEVFMFELCVMGSRASNRTFNPI